MNALLSPRLRREENGQCVLESDLLTQISSLLRPHEEAQWILRLTNLAVSKSLTLSAFPAVLSGLREPDQSDCRYNYVAEGRPKVQWECWCCRLSFVHLVMCFRQPT
jgi:hypothetical protein